ncbi:MAG: hypothetical protein GY710_22990 [Desulfobacteraceae bacterium]|nr:hypothetical protein [Desulfobacteraceae bacterium]
MRPLKTLLMSVIALLLIPSISWAGDYDWIKNFNIEAKADPSDLKTRLEARFKMGTLKIQAVLDNAANPADAYILLRLGEMSDQPMDHIIAKYKAEKNKGWGALAKSLGIKPGSKDFHALKQDQDLYDDKNKGKSKNKNKKRFKK